MRNPRLLFLTLGLTLALGSQGSASIRSILADMPRGVATSQLLAAKPDSEKMPAQSTPVRAPKSGLKAALLSAALPGLGQLYLDEKGRGQMYLIAEGATWATFAAFQIYSQWKKDDYRRLAKTGAGIDITGRPDDFIDILAFYNNVDEYNALGRLTESGRPYINPADSNNAWYWNDPAQRNTFRQLKNSSHEAIRRSQFAFGLAIVNRAASVIDAILTARKSIKRGIDDQFSFLKDMHMKVSLHPDRRERLIRLTWYPDL